MRQVQIKSCRERRLICGLTVARWHALTHPTFRISRYFRVNLHIIGMALEATATV